jgi:hypothetical protein
VKDRTIWGGLVAYDNVWVAGAHSATKISFSKDVIIGNKTVAKGTYALFAIPGKQEWTLMPNTNFNQHLADDYRQSEDVLRIKAITEKNKQLVSRLTYGIYPSKKVNELHIVFSWEYLTVALPKIGTPLR